MLSRRTLVVLLALLCCAAVAAPLATGAAPRTRITASPTTVQAGEGLRVRGYGWARRQIVVVYLGRTSNNRVRRLARVRTTTRGGFSRRVRIPASLAAGRWVVTACRRGCRLKRARAIRVVEPSPYGGID